MTRGRLLPKSFATVNKEEAGFRSCEATAASLANQILCLQPLAGRHGFNVQFPPVSAALPA